MASIRLRAVRYLVPVALVGALVAGLLMQSAGAHYRNNVGHLFQHVQSRLAYEVVVSPDVIVPGAGIEFLSIACPAGKEPVGGGIDTLQDNNSHDTLLVVVESYPMGTGWEGLVRNTRPAGQDSDAHVYAICANIKQ